MKGLWVLHLLLLAVLLISQQGYVIGDEGASAAVSVDGESTPVESTEANSKSDSDSKSKKAPQKKTQGRWNSVNFDAIEKDWEKGDDPELLEHEFEITRRINEKKRMERMKDAPQFVSPKLSSNGEEKLDPEEVQQLLNMAKADPLGLNMGSNGVMMFVELKEKKEGKTWSKKEVDKLASKWVQLLRTASLDGKIFNTQQDNPNPQKPTLLISVDKTWMVTDILKFILGQKETLKITHQNKDYTRENFPEAYGSLEEEDDDD
jgi:hypothetical protein